MLCTSLISVAPPPPHTHTLPLQAFAAQETADLEQLGQDTLQRLFRATVLHAARGVAVPVKLLQVCTYGVRCFCISALAAAGETEPSVCFAVQLMP